MRMRGKPCLVHTRTGRLHSSSCEDSVTASGSASTAAASTAAINYSGSTQYVLRSPTHIHSDRVHQEGSRPPPHCRHEPYGPHPHQSLRSHPKGPYPRKMEANNRPLVPRGRQCEWWHRPSTLLPIIRVSGDSGSGRDALGSGSDDGQSGHQIGIPPSSSPPWWPATTNCTVARVHDWGCLIESIVTGCSHSGYAPPPQSLVLSRTHWSGVWGRMTSNQSTIIWMTSSYLAGQAQISVDAAWNNSRGRVRSYGCR